MVYGLWQIALKLLILEFYYNLGNFIGTSIKRTSEFSEISKSNLSVSSIPRASL